MSDAPRFILRSTGTPTFSSIAAYISPSRNSSVKFLELTTTLRPLLVPETVVLVGAAAAVVLVAAGAGVAVESPPHAVNRVLRSITAANDKTFFFTLSLLGY